MLKRVLLAAAVSAVLVAGCKKKEAAPAVADPTPAPAAEAASSPAATEAAKPAATPTETGFDISTVPVSDKPLGEWPYLVLPAGYSYSDKANLTAGTKDLARVAVWTGSDLLWNEGKVFENRLTTDDGKTYSQFELRKGIQQALEGLGAKRLSTTSYKEDLYKAHEKELETFRQEFDDIRDAYWYEKEADTYVIHRADKAVWIVVSTPTSGSAAVMVSEGPLPVKSGD